MKVLVVYPKNFQNTHSYYEFIQSIIHQFCLDEAIAEITLKKSSKISLPNDCIVKLPIDKQHYIDLLFWQSFTLPKIIKKLHINSVIFIDSVCCVKIAIPQIAILTQTQFLNSKNIDTYHRFLRSFFKKSIHAVSKILTYSEYAAEQLQAYLKNTKQRPILVQPAVANDAFHERSFRENETLKATLTHEMDFFLAKVHATNENQLINLLKAFTLFKNWQKSSMKLVISGFEKYYPTGIRKKIDTYKLREDVIILTKEQSQLYPDTLSACYAYFLLTNDDADLLPFSAVTKSGSVLVAQSLPSMNEIANDCYIPITENTFEEIGKKMIAIYRQEHLRDAYIRNARKKDMDFLEVKNKLYQILFDKQ